MPVMSCWLASPAETRATGKTPHPNYNADDCCQQQSYPYHGCSYAPDFWSQYYIQEDNNNTSDGLLHRLNRQTVPIQTGLCNTLNFTIDISNH
ncbi:hypothetical protein PoB_001396100 [Plakobranchus ocellatus]|uniref:Uncharacterized protein n=1 Tax=Plakobranchus ocellatus TaxID=259542 RepID=A0AAV3YJP2_9GAST|nr:hypothetical protein PoB_001396100 [Plakobranchus ocellatus]